MIMLVSRDKRERAPCCYSYPKICISIIRVFMGAMAPNKYGNNSGFNMRDYLFGEGFGLSSLKRPKGAGDRYTIHTIHPYLRHNWERLSGVPTMPVHLLSFTLLVPYFSRVTSG